jgi:hypothetical protein
MRITLTAALAAALLAPAAARADLYRYETEQGTVAFTDDIERVPARYRASAKREDPRDLESYSRLTIVPKGATTHAPPARAEAESVAEAPPGGAVIEAPRPSLEIGLGGSRAIEIPFDPSSDEPIVVRRRQYRLVDDGAAPIWKPFVVIQQGDRIIAEIEPNAL